MIIQIIDGEDRTRYVNSENVTHIQQCPQLYVAATQIYFKGGDYINIHTKTPKEVMNLINEKLKEEKR